VSSAPAGSVAGTGSVELSRDGAVATIKLSRPERHNALSEVLWNGLDSAVAEIERDLPRVVVITGDGDKAFCAGMDVNPDNPLVAGIIEAVQTGDPGPVGDMLRKLRAIVDRLAALPVPLIAALNGMAYGGGAEIALRCDLRVMDPAATLCFSEVRLGLMPDMGGSVALTRAVGPAIAADLILTARKVSADEALRLGVVSRVSAPGAVLEEAYVLARAIAENGPRAVRAALAIIRKVPDETEEQALARELAAAIELIAGGECQHGITAFMTRQKPTFPDPSAK